MIPIHVVNLERRLDRKTLLLEQFEKHSITDYVFTKAVAGDSLVVADLKRDGLIENETLTAGQYGCYFSHLNILRSILDSDQELHMVLEDDIYFVDDFNKKLNRLLRKIQNVEWDIFYIGINCYWPECRQGEYVGKRIDGIYYPKCPIWGTHAFIIKKTAVEKIIDSMLPIRLPFDVHLMTLDIKRLTLLNTIVKTDNADSDTL